LVGDVHPAAANPTAASIANTRRHARWVTAHRVINILPSDSYDQCNPKIDRGQIQCGDDQDRDGEMLRFNLALFDVDTGGKKIFAMLQRPFPRGSTPPDSAEQRAVVATRVALPSCWARVGGVACARQRSLRIRRSCDVTTTRNVGDGMYNVL
jgi:hypothetical protein